MPICRPILYLSHAVKPLSSQIEVTDEHKLNIDPTYVDDISFLIR